MTALSKPLKMEQRFLKFNKKWKHETSCALDFDLHFGPHKLSRSLM